MNKIKKKRKVKKNSNRNNTPNYFGIGKSPSYLGGKSNISFLSSKQIPLKRVKQNKMKPLFNLNNKKRTNSKPANFLSRGKVMPKQKYINWNYKRIKKRFPNINPFGDVDMDGSMNYKDCKPFDASRDGNLMDIMRGIIFKKGKEEAISGLPENLQKKVKAKLKRKEIYEAKQKGIERAERRRLSTKQEKYLTTAQKGFAAKLIEKASKKPKVDMDKIARVLAAEKLAKKIAKRKEFAETGAGVRALTRKILYKKAPITKKGKVVGYKTVLRGGKPVSIAALKAAALAGVPVKIPKEKGKAGKSGKTYASAGRPKGPSGKYQIPGKGPVYEHEYKKWLTKQRALARIKAEQARGIPQEDISEVPEENEVLEEYGEPEEAVEPEEVEEPQPTPQPQQLTPEQIQRIRQIQQMRQAQQAQQTQQYPQQRPSQTVGGPVPDNILHAPNVARGELRISQSGQEIQSTSLGAKPQVNPRGEYYTNIDPMTGKPIMQRRVSEKFATGEAL